jgi:formate C-acetyltransferase
MCGCIERGTDMHLELDYTPVYLQCQGFANLVNGLSAVERVVFERKAAGLHELGAALSRDFAGAEPLRQALLAAPKWGNDDTAADRWAAVWLRTRTELCEQVTQRWGGPLIVPELVVRSLHHVHGRKLGATPDGRRAGEPLADSVGAVRGTGLRGPTALFNSVCGMDAARHWPGGYNLNMTLPAARWSDPSTLAKLHAMVDAFFGRGGQELQINCLDPGALREAQRCPERYRDLMVRIAGFNAFFVSLSAAEQEEIVERAEAACSAPAWIAGRPQHSAAETYGTHTEGAS